MEDYLKIANSGIVFILAIILILFVLIQSIIFLIVAWRRGKEIGISKQKMINTVKSSAVFSIVPSIPIVISLIAVVPIFIIILIYSIFNIPSGVEGVLIPVMGAISVISARIMYKKGFVKDID